MTRNIWLLILLLLAWIILGAWLCKKLLCDDCDNHNHTEKAIAAAPLVEEGNVWNYNDGNGHQISTDERLRFNSNGFAHLLPLSASLKSSLQTTASYLKTNPKRALEITGYYEESEKNNSIFPNLGIARANDIKSYLKEQGAPVGQVTLIGKLIGKDQYENNILVNGIDFSFNEAAIGDDRLKAISDRLKGKPITLYFATNSDDINLSAQQRTDFADLSYYLDNVSEGSLAISGHTDSRGNRGYNVNLSKERADFAADYLTTKGGISRSRMSTVGNGPDKAIGDNATEEGRAKNRRVEVRLQ